MFVVTVVTVTVDEVHGAVCWVTVTVDEVHGADCWDTVAADGFECTGHSG
jgi:hypothetical protein